VRLIGRANSPAPGKKRHWTSTAASPDSASIRPCERFRPLQGVFHSETDVLDRLWRFSLAQPGVLRL